MTEKRVYLASVGPIIFDDTEELDDTEGIFTGRKQAALTTDGSLILIAGADMIFEGADSFGGGYVNFKGSTKAVRFFTSGTGANLYLIPESHADVTLVLGVTPTAGTPSYGRYNVIDLQVQSHVNITVNDSVNATNYRFQPLVFSPTSHKGADTGSASTAWDNVYADDFNNVADFFNLDSVDDLATLEAIKGSGMLDPDTGLELIDDDTLPEWMLARDKKSKEVVRDPDGKPYLSLKLVTSLLMGACRQLNSKIQELEKKLTK